MNRITLIVFFMLFLIACFPPKSNPYSLTIYVVNNSASTINLILYIDKLGINDSRNTRYRIDSGKLQMDDSIVFRYETVVNYKYGGISVDTLKLYNLADTSFLQFTLDELYSQNLKNIYVHDEENSSIFSNIYKLTITNEFLTLFHKDTSMLTKFKDYYNK